MLSVIFILRSFKSNLILSNTYYTKQLILGPQIWKYISTGVYKKFDKASDDLFFTTQALIHQV